MVFKTIALVRYATSPEYFKLSIAYGIVIEDKQSRMENLRIKFLPNKQKEFLDTVYRVSGLNTDRLAEFAKIHPRSFRDWKRERLTMTLFAAELFCEMFKIFLPEEKASLISRWQKTKQAASKIGGIERFKKHGSPATEEGRRKGGAKALANFRRNGIIPRVKTYNQPAFCKELAEYVGIMLGDGGLTLGQCTVTLNSIADREYINFVSSFSRKLFGEPPKHFQKKDCNAVALYYNGSSLVRYLLQIGLKIGNKVKQQVDVPIWILAEKSFRISCLRGLMDTDGGVFLHRYKVGGKEYKYKKISFSNRSAPLLLFVKNTLAELGFTPKIIDKVENKKVWLYNTNEVERYLEVVGTHNPRLLKWNGG